MSETPIIPIPRVRLDRRLLCAAWLLAACLRPCLLRADTPAGPDRAAPEVAGLIAQIISECESADGFEASTGGSAGTGGRVSIQATAAARVEGNSIQVAIQAAPAGIAELRIPWRVQEAPAFVALWIKNPVGHEVALAVSLVGTAGTTTLPVRRLGDERNWCQLAFAVPPEYVGDIAAVGITFSELSPARDYEFYVDRIQAYRQPPLKIDARVQCPSEAISAGGSFDVRLALTPADSRPRWPHMELVLRRNGFAVSAASPSIPGSPAEGKTADCGPIALAVPPACAPGLYEVALEGGIAIASAAKWPTVEIAGGPVPPRPAELLSATGVVGELDATGAAAGLRLQMLDVACAYDLYGRCSDVWVGADEFDYSDIDMRLSRLIRERPDSSVLLRVYIYSPPWWDRQHPSDLLRFGDGTTQAPAGVPGRKHTYASWASETWRSDAEKALRALIAHVEGLPVAPAVVGYLLCSGEWGNWQYPGATRGLFADYGTPQTISYRQWLRERYGGLPALRIAWNQPGSPDLTEPDGIADGRPILAWTQIDPPTPKERMTANIGMVRDPAGEQHLVDYDAFASDAMADAISAMAAVVASAAPEKLCGAAYGHILDQARYPYALQNGGHLAMPTLADCDDIDFVTVPAVGLPGQSGHLATFGVCDASLRARDIGIIYTWPWYLDPPGDARWARNLAVQAVCSGASAGIPAALIDDGLRAIDAARAGAGRPHRADVAVVLDHYSIAHTTSGNAVTGPLLDEQRRAVSLMGMPADVWFLEDVLSGSIPVYRFYLVPDAFFLQVHDRAALRAQLAREGATGMYVYLAGAIDETIGGRTMKDLMGITAVRMRGVGPLQVSLGDGLTYGAREPVSPRFVFGRDGDPVAGVVGSGRGGLVERRSEAGLVVWSAAPNVPAGVLREYAAAAGAHLYCDSQAAVYGAGPLLGVRATQSGRHRLRLPEAVDVHDCITGQRLGADATTIELDLEQGDTVLLRLGSQPESAP